jgi:transposase
MAKRRRFTGDFKAKVALEALRGERPIQDIAAKYGVHPNQVSTWKKQAIDGLGTVFSDNAEKAERDHEATVRDLHAKIGELTVERGFLERGLKR